jgi:hypothetical protein
MRNKRKTRKGGGILFDGVWKSEPGISGDRLTYSNAEAGFLNIVHPTPMPNHEILAFLDNTEVRDAFLALYTGTGESQEEMRSSGYDTMLRAIQLLNTAVEYRRKMDKDFEGIDSVTVTNDRGIQVQRPITLEEKARHRHRTEILTNLLKELKEVVSDCCITIILNTHRNKQQYDLDRLQLRKLVKEADNRLFQYESEEKARLLSQRMKDLVAQLQFDKNLDCLILFINENVTKFIHLPIQVENRVVIDSSFATRDLVRLLQMKTNYFVLVFSEYKARLLEGFDDTLIQEYTNPFPMENNELYSTKKIQLKNADLQNRLLSEFYNRIDKAVNEVRNDNPKPVLLCSQEMNCAEYLKVADLKESIFPDFMKGNKLYMDANEIIREAWQVVRKQQFEKNRLRKQELEDALASGQYISDANEIWQATTEGRIRTVFIEENLFRPARIDNNTITFVSEEDRNKPGVVDDIYDEIIEATMNSGAEVVFLPKGELIEFNGLGAVTRF